MRGGNKFYPVLLNLLVSTIILFIVFGNILSSPNYVFFSKSGDGLKSTFGSYYHLQYDSSYWHTASMNYPYGESVLFTGGQALIINTLKLLSNFGIDLSNQLTGILNTWLLLSIVWAALFLFLLLRDFKLPWWYALIAANIITFLSPQMARFGGHFNLAYVYFLPLFLYLLKRFFDHPTYKMSFIIGAVSFLALGTQAYFFALYAFWIFFVLLYGYFYEKDRFGKLLPSFLHLLIQIVLPFILFNLLTISEASDRSAFPWGFFETRSFPEAVFLPADKDYARFIHFSYFKWEGIAFVGMVASITTLVIIINYIKKKIKVRTRWHELSGNAFLDAILLGSVVALLISFAYPFQWDLQWLLKYTGPFKQFRAIGRFNWLFYYTINIVAFYLVWNFYQNKKSLFSKIILIAALLWGTYDAYLNVRGNGKWLDNSIPQLADVQNKLPENQCYNQINPKDFQAILTIPYFHIGSEVYWIGHSSEAEKNSFIASWKTGLPLVSVMLSRTSISQTMKSLALYFEPLSKYEILEEYPNKKDLLLLRQKNELLNENEARFMQYAIPLSDNKQFRLFRLPLDSMKKMNYDFRNRIIRQASDSNLVEQNGFLISDLGSPFIYQSFGNKTPDNRHSISLLSADAMQTCILMDTVLFDDTNALMISFWMKDLNQDLIPRSQIKLNVKGSEGGFRQKFSGTVFKQVKYVNAGGWGLVELEYHPAKANERLRIEISNDLVSGGNFAFDDVLICQKNNAIFFRGKDFVFKNNRFVKKQ